MDNYEALTAMLALLLGTSWASGINLYAVLLVLGFGGSTGYIDLPEELLVLEDPLIISAAGVMYFVEFIADKIPGVDSTWDAVHTFIRIPAGAMLAAGMVGDVTPALEIAAGILGGGLAATSHTTKSSARLLINTSPEPATNWTASVSEDLLVIGGLWTALNYPLVFLFLLLVFIILIIWMLPKIWWLIKVFFAKISNFSGVHQFLTHKDDNSVKSRARIEDVGQLAKLKRLQHLRDSGALTEAVFRDQKNKISVKQTQTKS